MKIKSLKSLGQLLDTSPDRLKWVLKNRSRFEKEVVRSIKGKERPIYMSWGPLRAVQDRIKKLLNVEPEHSISHNCKGRSAQTNAERHVGSEVLIKVDIQNFFPSISVQNVFWLFRKLGCTEPVARTLARFTTYKNRLPQGAPTSSKLASLKVLALDEQLSEFCLKRSLAVSRLVDDISVSGDGADRYVSQVVQMVEAAGFKVQRKKTAIAFRHEQQMVTGLIVNTKPRVSRKKRRELKAMCHACSVKGTEKVATENGKTTEEFISHLQGWLSYAGSKDPLWRTKMLCLAGLK